MNKPRVLVTGATGFIGTHLISSLAQLEYDVLAICRSEPNSSFDNINWCKADLSEADTYKVRIAEFSPEIVVHLAWLGIPDYSFDNSIKNLSLTTNFLSFVTSLDSCKKVVVSGSCWEYGSVTGECNEDSIAKCDSYFSWAKNSILAWLKFHCQINKIDFVWLRLFYVYGPGQRLASLLPSILTSLANRDEPSIQAPLNANDYIFIDDVVDAFLISIEKSFQSGVYNIGSGKSVRALDILTLARARLKFTKNLSLPDDPLAYTATSYTNFWANISKAKKYLGWKPSKSLYDGIGKTIEHLNNR